MKDKIPAAIEFKRRFPDTWESFSDEQRKHVIYAMNGWRAIEQLEPEGEVCSCTRGRGTDYDENGVNYCIDCNKSIYPESSTKYIQDIDAKYAKVVAEGEAFRRKRGLSKATVEEYKALQAVYDWLNSDDVWVNDADGNIIENAEFDCVVGSLRKYIKLP